MKNYTRTLLIVAILSFLLVGWLGITKFTTNKQLKQVKKLAQAEALYIDKEYDLAFEIYEELPSAIFSEELKEKRKNAALFIDTSQQDGGTFYIGADFRKQMQQKMKSCGISQDLQMLTDKALFELFLTCYASKKSLIDEKSSIIDEKSANGFLKFKNKSGTQIYYLGRIEDSLAQGHGVGLYANENYYVGEWKNNKRHGEGEFITKNGAFYRGTYKYDERNGFGEYHFRNGDFYRGYWKDGKRDSIGSVLSPKGDTIVFGIWNNDRLNRRETRKFLKNKKYKLDSLTLENEDYQ